MNERRSGLFRVVETFAAVSGTALIGGLVAHASSIWIPGLVVLIACLFGFSSLLFGLPFRSLARSESDRPTANTPESEVTPAVTQPVYLTEAQAMLQLGPNSWLSGYGPRDPDVTLRAVVAIPALWARDYSRGPATEERAEVRENWLIDVLNYDSLTTWLRKPFEPTPWRRPPSWHVRGSGNSDMTDLVFAPSVDSSQAWPFQGRCVVLTGWRISPAGEKSKALTFVVELQFNRWTSTNAVIGGESADTKADSLSLYEVANDLLRLANSLDLSTAVCRRLLPDVNMTSGYFGLWFTVRGQMLERVVDLAGLSRVADPTSINEARATGSWESSGGPIGETWGTVIARMFDELLESAGYRGVQNQFNWLR